MCSAALLWTGLALSGCIITAVYGVPDTDSGGGSSGSTAAATTGGDSEGSTTAPTTGMTGTMGTGTDASTTAMTTTGSTGSTGTTDGTGTTDATGTSGTSDQPLYGVVDPP